MRRVEDGVGHRHLRRQRGARARGAHRARAARRAPPRARPARRSARRAPSAQSTKPPSSAAATLSGWPSIARREREQVGVELEHRVGGEQAGDDRGRARAEAARERHVRSGCGTRTRRPGAAARTRARARLRRSRAIARSVSTAKRPGLHHLELDVQPERAREHVEARPEVGRRGGDADEPARALPSAQHGVLDGRQVRLARHDRAGLRERRLRVLEPVAGQHAGDAARRRRRRT